MTYLVDRSTRVPIPLPMAGHCAILDLRGAFTDHHRGVDDAALATAIGPAVRFTPSPTGPECLDQLAAQFTASLNVEGLVDGFVHHVPFPFAGELDRQSVADLLRAPLLLKPGLHEVA